MVHLISTSIPQHIKSRLDINQLAEQLSLDLNDFYNMAFGPKVNEVSKTTSVVGCYLVFAGLISYFFKENLYIRECLRRAETDDSRRRSLDHRRRPLWPAVRRASQSIRMV